MKNSWCGCDASRSFEQRLHMEQGTHRSVRIQGHHMNLQRMYYPVLTLGPGRRIGLWTRGCAKHCPGCMSEDLKEMDPRREVPLLQLIHAIDAIWASQPVDGVTVSGGEPFDQAEELEALLRHLRTKTNDVLVYTGYTMAEIDADPRKAAAAKPAGVLITGRYVKELNDGRALRGSSNQQIHFFEQSLQSSYGPVLAEDRTLQVGQGIADVFLIGLLG